MIAPRLSKNENGVYDLKRENGRIVWASDGTQAAQSAMQRLMTFRGENSLNGKLTGHDDTGTRYYEVIFKADVDKAQKELELKSQILGTGIDGLLKWEWNQTLRTVYVNAIVKTAWGTEIISEEIEPL
jgi:hypothetical protein